MAQLVMKRASWWEFNTKQAMVWIPVATLQMGTLAGLGYFYHRLTDLEAQTEELSSLEAASGQLARTALRQADKPQNGSVSERILPKPAAVPLQIALDRQDIVGTMSAGANFFATLSPPLQPSENIALTVDNRAGKAVNKEVLPAARVVNSPAKSRANSDGAKAKKVSTIRLAPVTRAKRVGRSVTKPVVAARPASSIPKATTLLHADVEAARTAAANRAGLYGVDAMPQLPELSLEEAALPPVVQAVAVVEPEAVSLPVPAPPTASKKPLPVGTVTWVYLGELRAYGWHGQRLHVAPDSGLPVVGDSYHTQELHGLYDRPHGNRAMGGFQQGDLITILEVVHEPNNGVWAKVRKVQSVGRVKR